MKKLCFFLIMTVIAVVGCTPAADSGVDQATVQAMVDEIWGNGNMDAVDQNYAADFVRHNPSSWEPAMTEGTEAFKEMVANTREQFPDLKVTIDDMIGTADARAARWTATGTHSETGNPVTFSGISFIRYNAEGKTIEEWVAFDTQGLMQQVMSDMEMDTSMK